MSASERHFREHPEDAAEVADQLVSSLNLEFPRDEETAAAQLTIKISVDIAENLAWSELGDLAARAIKDGHLHCPHCGGRGTVTDTVSHGNGATALEPREVTAACPLCCGGE